ncbi:MAG: hypothetical protein AAGI08_04565 [Bacteroidota bacterium]
MSTSRAVLLIAVLVLSGCDTSVSQQATDCSEGVFRSQEGVIAFEAERVPLSTGWVRQDEVDGYSGEGYLTWKLETNTQANGQGLLRYRFEVEEPGTYTVKIRNYHPCEDITECNDIFVRMNAGPWRKNFNHTFSAWDWNSRQDIDHEFSDATYELEVGVHTLDLSGRSKDFSIDKIAIYHADTPADAYQQAAAVDCTAER